MVIKVFIKWLSNVLLYKHAVLFLDCSTNIMSASPIHLAVENYF